MSLENRRYEVLKILGQGGFGTVFHARFVGEGGFSKEVALKVLNPEMEGVAEIASRLRDEARVLGLIRHRAIVGVDLLTQLDGRWTVVMEYIEGHDLGQIIELGPVPPGAALEIVAEVAGALHAAYSRMGPQGAPLRLLHRDLKPSNIRITPFGEVKVLDFGIARAEFGEREARTRSLAFGTPEYMSPERLDFSGDSAAGDIYAVGAVMFELVTGAQLGRTSANPNKHTRKLELAQRTLQEVGMPAQVMGLLQRMLAFEDQDRPSAVEVERQALALARASTGPGLREWIDGITFPEPGETQHPLSGSILVERAEAPAVDEKITLFERVPTPAPEEVGRRLTPPAALIPSATRGVPGAPTPAPTVSPMERSVARGPGPSLPRDPVPSRPSPRSYRAIVAVLVFCLIVGGAALGLLSGREPNESTASPPAGTQAAAPPEVGRPTSPPAAKQVKPASSTTQPSEVPAAPPSDPIPTPPAPKASPRPSADPSRQEHQGGSTSSPGLATVTVSGDAWSVALESLDSGRRYGLPNAKIPAGEYHIVVGFFDEAPSRIATTTLKAGGTFKIDCQAMFGKCTVTH